MLVFLFKVDVADNNLRIALERNNFSGKSFLKPSKENVGRWENRINDSEAQLIEYHFKDIMENFGYKCKFNLKDQQKAAAEHYKWFNFSTPYSAK